MLRRITCVDCGQGWDYEIRQGRPSPRCPECRETAKREKRRDYDAARPKETERARSRRYRASLSPEQKALNKERERLWREANPGKYFRQRQEYYYARPADEVISLRAMAVCYICKSTDPRDRRGFHVDHDHACCPGVRSCGKCVRALLCGPCNTFVGFLEADATRTSAAMRYVLENPRVDWSDHQAEVL